MFTPSVFWCILLLSTLPCFAEETDEEELDPAETPWGTDDVAELTSLTFQDFIATNPSVLVAFYAPWCGHCQRFKPEYAKAATTVRGEGLGQLAAMDCDEKTNEKICKEMEVEGFPTVKYFKERVSMDYTDGRTSDDVIAFMRKSPTPPPPEPPVEWGEDDVIQLDATTFPDFIAANPSVLAMFYKPDNKFCKRMRPTFQAGAKMVNIEKKADGKLVAVDCKVNEEFCKEQGITRVPKAKYFKDGVFAHGFAGERTPEGIVAFMKDPKPPPAKVPPPPPEEPKPWKDEENTNVIHLEEASFDAFLEKEPRVFVAFYAPWCGASRKVMPLLENVAVLANVENQLGGKLVAVDCVENKALCERYKISRYPTGIYIKDATEQIEYDGGPTMEELLAFAKLHEAPRPAEESKADKELEKEIEDAQEDVKEDAKDEL